MKKPVPALAFTAPAYAWEAGLSAAGNHSGAMICLSKGRQTAYGNGLRPSCGERPLFRDEESKENSRFADFINYNWPNDLDESREPAGLRLYARRAAADVPAAHGSSGEGNLAAIG